MPSPFAYEYTAEYSTEGGAVVYTVLDVVGNPVVRIRFIPKPFN